MTAASISANRRRLAAQALLATEARLAATPAVPAKEAATVTTPVIAKLDRASMIALLQDLLAEDAPAAAPAPVAVAPALTPIEKAQAFWQTDYAGKGVPVRQIANGRWVDVKGAFCKAPKNAPKASVGRVEAGSAGVAKGAASQGELLAKLLAVLGGEGAVAEAAAPAAAPKAAAMPALRRDGTWLRCGLCEEAYWGAHRTQEEVARKYRKHLAKAHAGK